MITSLKNKNSKAIKQYHDAVVKININGLLFYQQILKKVRYNNDVHYFV